MKILVTPRSVTRNGHRTLDKLTLAGYEVIFSTPGQFPTEEELIELLPGCVGYLAGVEPITAKVLDAATDLKAISRNGTGADSVDLEAAERNGIKVCRAIGANARGVAELAFGHILAAVRSIPFSDAAMKKQDWQRRKGIELENRTLGLVGCGKIGQLVAKFAAGFDMKVLAYDPYPSADFNPTGDFVYVELDEVLAKSDFLSLHCPANSDGTPLIGIEAVSKLKEGVYIVNTARGTLLDTDAIVAALDNGKIAGVTLDAFEPEPPTDWRLAEHQSVVATPHIGGFTSESVHRAMSVAVDNLMEAIG